MNETRLHGVAHWARVAKYGEVLADKVGLRVEYKNCVSVFVWIHDLARFNDSEGDEHAIACAGELDTLLPVVNSRLATEQ